MHELPATQGILERTLEHAAKANALRVVAIHLVVGDRSGMSPECIEFYWEAISRGTVAQGASVHVRRVPFELRCLECDRSFSPTHVAFGYECPACGGVRVEISHGQECCLEAIDIDERRDPIPD